MIKRTLPLFLFACLGISASAVASDPFVGDWKLNPAKSTLTDKMTVESAGNNKYTFNLGGGPETVVIDGTDQPTPYAADGTLAVGVEGDTWKVVRKSNGRTIVSATWSLSRDGSILTDHFTSFNADGSPYALNYAYKRKAGGSGFTGTWVSVSLEAVNYIVLLQIRPYEEGGLTFVDAASQLTGNVQFAPSSVRRVDERTIELMRKKGDGELSHYLDLKLSADLNTLTITPHSAIPGEPHIIVFDRQ